MKNENCIFSFFKFWNMNLNCTFGFFEKQIPISIWVSIKIETKLEFMEVDCDVKEFLSDWQMFAMYYVWFYSMTSTLNDNFLKNKMDRVGKGQVREGKEGKGSLKRFSGKHYKSSEST